MSTTSQSQTFSSLALQPQSTWEEESPHSRHCESCTCNNDDVRKKVEEAPRFPCGSPKHEDEFNHLPPPLPEPKYSVHKRILPASLTALSSPKGREYLLHSLTQNSAESYWALMEQFVNQSDPAFCGITTLMMVMNTMCIDPNVRWKSGWRFFGSEEVLLDRCCLSMERISRVGVTLEEFRMLAKCHGLSVELKRPFPSDEHEKQRPFTGKHHHHHRPTEFKSLECFREDVKRVLTTPESKSILVVSFSRAALEQTGDGHFSPIAAYHEPSDQVLVLDVARFKYAPYWVPVQEMYRAMQPKDSATKRSRGWFVLNPPKHHSCYHHTKEMRRPAELVPVVGEPDVCPLGKVKVEYCQANPKRHPR
jgi:glutathione gamma-glutamylcysteinyltransferase